MGVTRKTLFESDSIQIGLFEARPATDKCGDVERQTSNAVVLPFSGVFSKHDAPGRQVIGTPSHAVFVASDTPYRISFPGAIGDRAVVLRFNETLTPDRLEAHRGETVASYGLLSADALLLRHLLLSRLERGEGDRFEIEALGLDLLDMSLGSMRSGSAVPRRATMIRRERAVSRVKEAVAAAPSEKWNVTKLAKVAGLSPFHLCHVFRQIVGTTLYDYVLRERLALALDAVLGGADDFTAVAFDAGFASHSHFTARFRSFFGRTPAALRRFSTSQRVADLRKIVTA